MKKNKLREIIREEISNVLNESTDFTLKKKTKISDILVFAKKNRWKIEKPKKLKFQDGVSRNVYFLTMDNKNWLEIIGKTTIAEYFTLRGPNPDVLTQMVDTISNAFGEIIYED